MSEWMNAVRSAWGRFEVMLEDVIREEEDLLVVTELLRGQGHESGAQVEMRVFSVYRFEGGRARRRQAFTEREEALAAADA